MGYRKFSERPGVTLGALGGLGGAYRQFSSPEAPESEVEQTQISPSTPPKAPKPPKVRALVPAHTPYAGAFNDLAAACPAYVEPDRWQRCLEDARAFLPTWGEQAAALGWTADDLFQLHSPPPNPKPSYSRLSRHDCRGLLWGLDGCRVVALSSNSAVVATVSGARLTHRRPRQ
jgi:hypothetical protein